MASINCVNLSMQPLLRFDSKTTDIYPSGQKKPSFIQFIRDKQQKKNFDQILHNNFFKNTSLNQIDQTTKNRQIFDIPSYKMINYDEQLKQYLSGDKIFKQKNHNMLDFAYQQKSSTFLVNKHPKHQRMRSRSQLAPQKYSSFDQLQFNNGNMTYVNQKCGITRVNKQSNKQNANQEERRSQLRRKTQKSTKSIKFWEIDQEKLKHMEVKSLEMQLIFKKANQKRQSMIKEIIKKLHLPQLNPKLSNNLRMLVDIYPLKNEIQSQHRSIKLQKSKNSKLFIGKFEGLSSLKVQEGKGKLLRRVEKEVHLKKIKFNKMREEQVTSRSRHDVKQGKKIQNFRLFGRK